jgi:hypothetical protein
MPFYERVRTGSDPVDALLEARRLGTPLVTGSLYLLAELHEEARPSWRTSATS